jgi:predicted RNase H-like HicB family nuclease
MKSGNHDIAVEFDEASRSYFIVWAPLIASAGDTEHEALEELRDAAHFGVDAMIDMKLKDTKR